MTPSLAGIHCVALEPEDFDVLGKAGATVPPFSRFDARGVTNLVKMVHKQERLIEQALGISEPRLQPQLEQRLTRSSSSWSSWSGIPPVDPEAMAASSASFER